MIMRPILSFLLLLAFFTLTGQTSDNPAAEGFRASASDPQAIQLADEVMQAMGGRTAWDNTHFIRWTFFGRRTLLWDKWTGKVRIDFPDKEDVFIVDINTGEGKIWLNGEEQTQPDTLAKYTAQARSIWINDAYWLVMPYKLKDTGVTLRYLGQQQQGDTIRHQLQLTFENVGDTPENKYWVFVDDQTKLVDEWQFFPQFDDATPRFSTPWADYKPYGAILLSGNRGRGQLTDIAVYDELPASVFLVKDPYER
ncbi:MAG: hypothetical protein DA408_05900 [Bacteroidetes bacterium]|nr:MAG: hypothetical protein C7N36_01800 [Bacteroidota bacterium]PTM13664.1 MAG: hypothetical protein DA408_05900 [Bacteroidota bacterium]